MGASAIEFRLRMLILFLIIALGFWAPWIEAWSLGSRVSMLEWLALELSRTGIAQFRAATPIVIVVASLIALVAVVLRVSGTAFLGAGIVNDAAMNAGKVMADGPYRYVRNPLYLGLWCMFLAMSFLMPPTGAAFVMALSTLFLLRLIFGEEKFLSSQIGESYLEYLRAVPRIVPRLRTRLPRAGTRPQWIPAMLAEINPIGVFVIFACLSWSYDNWLMIKAVLITFGVSLVVRALTPATPEGAATTA